jgi:RHS repeat-associated protein
VERYSYDVFGKPNTISGIGNPYLFTGRRYDTETALYYYRARYYDYYIGRFLQTDPIGYGASLNLYTYCRNNPLNWIDPAGLCKEDLFGRLFSGIGQLLTGAINLPGELVAAVLEDVSSHFTVSFYVKGQNDIVLPVKVFNSRRKGSGLPGLAGFAMNAGGEIHIGPEMALKLIAGEANRFLDGTDLSNDPITRNGKHGSLAERTMAHELGHQVDAEKFGPVLYQVLGFILTQNRNSDFERNASLRGEYYGIRIKP